MAAAAAGIASALPKIIDGVNKIVKTSTDGAAKIKGTQSGSDQRRVAIGNKRRRKKNSIRALPPSPIAKNYAVNQVSPTVNGKELLDFVHSEPFFQPISTTDFTCANVGYNPGLRQFSASSQFAKNYSYYRQFTTTITFVPTVNSTTDGKIYLGFNPKSGDTSVLHGQVEVMNYKGTVSGPARNKLVLKIPSNQLMKPNQKYMIRDSALGDGDDVELYDSFLIYIGVEGCASSGDALGTVQIEHHVQFLQSKYTADEKESFFFYTTDASSIPGAPFGTPGTGVIEHSGLITATPDLVGLIVEGHGYYIVHYIAYSSVAHDLSNISLAYTKYWGTYSSLGTMTTGTLGMGGYVYKRSMRLFIDGKIRLEPSFTGTNISRFECYIVRAPKALIT